MRQTKLLAESFGLFFLSYLLNEAGFLDLNFKAAKSKSRNKGKIVKIGNSGILGVGVDAEEVGVCVEVVGVGVCVEDVGVGIEGVGVCIEVVGEGVEGDGVGAYVMTFTVSLTIP